MRGLESFSGGIDRVPLEKGLEKSFFLLGFQCTCSSHQCIEGLYGFIVNSN